jgi:hypothetical protein
MKKLYLLIPAICFFLILPANAQFDKGTVIGSVSSTIGLGDFGTDLMNIGYTTRKIKSPGGDINITYKTLCLNIMPRAGYFIMDNLAVGADIIASLSSQKSQDSDYKYSETLLAIGPFARYYYPLDNIYPFAEANVSVGSWKEKWSNGSEGDDTETMLIYAFGVGASKPIGEKVMIDALVGYSSQSWKGEDDYKYIYGTIGVRVGIIVLLAQ